MKTHLEMVKAHQDNQHKALLEAVKPKPVVSFKPKPNGPPR